MPAKKDQKPILDPARELPAPHDMLIEAEEKDGRTVPSNAEQKKANSTSSNVSKRPFPLWILPLLGLLIILIPAGMYFLNLQKEAAKGPPQATPSPTVTPTLIPEVSWQRYSDSKRNISFEYPNDWQIVEATDGAALYIRPIKNDGPISLTLTKLTGTIESYLKKNVRTDAIEKITEQRIDHPDYKVVEHQIKIKDDFLGRGAGMTRHITSIEVGNQRVVIEDNAASKSPLAHILSTFQFLEDTSTWKTYSTKEFSVKYPPSWYPEENPELHEGGHIEFFRVGTKADHGFGDHAGNEVFFIEVVEDQRTLEEIKTTYYPDAVFTSVAGKPAVQTNYNLFSVRISDKKHAHIAAGFKEAEKYRDTILSFLTFN